MIKLFLISIFLNIVVVKLSGSSVVKHNGKISNHFHKYKHYETISHPKEAKDDIDHSENMVIADKVKGETKKTTVTTAMLSTFGHRSRTNKNLSTPKIKSSRVELESSKMSTNFAATKQEIMADYAGRRKRVGGSQVMQSFKGEGQIEKSTPRPKKLSTADGNRRVSVNSMSENFGGSPENTTPASKKQMHSRATTNAQIIKTYQMNSKEKLSTRIGSTLPDPGATAKTNTPEECCKNHGVSHMCLDFCMGENNPWRDAGVLTEFVKADCKYWEDRIHACWFPSMHPDIKNEGEETSTESTTTESEENQPMENQMSQEITTLANDVKNDVDDTNTNLSPPLDVSIELNKIRTELDIISMLQREDRNYQTSINDIFEKLHRTSQEVYKDFTDALDEIKEIINGHDTNRQKRNFDEEVSSLETDVDLLKDDLETHNHPEDEISFEREYPISDMNDKTGSGRVKRFVANGDENLEEESLKKHKETRSSKGNKKKASKQHSGNKRRSPNGNANEKDHGGRKFVSKDELKELENVVNEMRKSFSIKINGLNNQVDILRKQLKIGKKKTQKEMKAIKEIPSIKKEIDKEFSISPPMTKSKSLGKYDAKPKVASGR